MESKRISVTADCQIEIWRHKSGHQNVQIGTDNSMNGVLDFPATLRSAAEAERLQWVLSKLIEDWPV